MRKNSISHSQYQYYKVLKTYTLDTAECCVPNSGDCVFTLEELNEEMDFHFL